MPTTAYKASGTQADASGVGTVAWTNPTNAAVSDNARATVVLNFATQISHWLRLTNFGFTTTDIPPGSLILGIEVNIERSGNNATTPVSDNQIFLRNGSGQVGTDHANAASWPTTDAVQAYGTASDTWSAGLTDTDVVASTFGIDISAKYVSGAGSNTAGIDYVEIRITYLPLGPRHIVSAQQAVQRANFH